MPYTAHEYVRQVYTCMCHIRNHWHKLGEQGHSRYNSITDDDTSRLHRLGWHIAQQPRTVGAICQELPAVRRVTLVTLVTVSESMKWSAEPIGEG